MKETFKNYQKVYRMLEDEESRDTYLNRLAYLISGEYKYIKNILVSYLPEMPVVSDQMQDLLEKLPRDRGIVLYGAGGRGAQVLQHFVKDKRFTGFCSNNVRKQAGGYLGYPVMSPEELLRRKDLTVLICAPSAREEIRRLLDEGGYPQDRVFELDNFTVATDPKQYFGPDFMVYEDEEVFVDAGSFDLGSSLELRRYCGRLKKAYAFEPDPGCYQKCLERKRSENLSEIEVFPFGTWSERQTLSFSSREAGGSRICQDSAGSIAVVPIDEMIPDGERVTFIKMDVEGAELESLKGAAKTIRRDRPKLAICIYHKTEDMVEIPLFIKELAPEYKLYVRMHENNGDETVLYALPPA